MKHRDLDRQQRNRQLSWSRLRTRRDDTETSQLHTRKDLQTMSGEQGNSAGVIRPDTGKLVIPEGAEDFDDTQQSTSPPRVMLVIVSLALLFITIIAYFVSQMPAKN